MIDQRKINPEIKNKRYSRRPSAFSRFIFRLVLLLFLGAAVYALFFSSYLALSNVEVRNNKQVESRAILEGISGLVSGKILGLVQKNNYLFISGKKLSDSLVGQFRQIRKVEVVKKFPSGLVLNIQERIPTAIVCAGPQCLVLDENGESYDVMDPDSMEAKNNHLFAVIDESQKGIERGRIIISPDYIGHAARIRNKLKELLDIETENRFRTPSFLSNDLRIKTAEGWEIYFNTASDVEKDIEILRMILEDKLTKEQRADLEYMDLRVDNKVYYKLKSDSPSELERRKAEEAAAAPPPVVEEKKKKKKD